MTDQPNSEDAVELPTTPGAVASEKPNVGRPSQRTRLLPGRLRRRANAEAHRAATLELFYDLVFVFTTTQVSHLLLGHLTWAGAAQAAIILLAVWWSWNYTTWATNELNPETNPVRFLMIALMLGSLLMAIAIPYAFGQRGLLFALSYVTIQIGRHAFLTFVATERGSTEREQAGRILIWFLMAGSFWIAGGLASGEARTWLWLGALMLDYIAPRILFPIPGRLRLESDSWHPNIEHFSERFGLIVIIAIGETIILTGSTAAGRELDPGTIGGIISAFAGSSALWWLYFISTREFSENSLGDEVRRTARARDIYTYGHALVVAGIILTAVGDEIVITHPLATLDNAQLVTVAGGPALFLLAQLALNFRARHRVDHIRLGVITGCAVMGLLGGYLPALIVHAELVAVLMAVALCDQICGRK